MEALGAVVLFGMSLSLFFALLGDMAPAKKEKPTEKDILDLGFKFLWEYEHDEWKSQIFVKGRMQVEFTRDRYSGKLDTFECAVFSETTVDDLESIKKLDKLLNG